MTNWKCFLCGRGRIWRKSHGVGRYPSLVIPAGPHQAPHPKRICSACIGWFRKMLEEYVNVRRKERMAGEKIPGGVPGVSPLESDQIGSSSFGVLSPLQIHERYEGDSTQRKLPKTPVRKENKTTMSARNMKFSIKGDILTVRVDLAKRLWVSNKGKSKNITIATSGGKLDLWNKGQPDPNGVQLNMNVFRPMTSEELKMDLTQLKFDEEES